MKIEFTKEDLDYLAWRISENLKGNETMIIDRALAQLPLRDLKLSARLRTSMKNAGFLDSTLREVSKYSPKAIMRLRNFGRLQLDELSSLMARAGVEWDCSEDAIKGWQKFPIEDLPERGNYE